MKKIVLASMLARRGMAQGTGEELQICLTLQNVNNCLYPLGRAQHGGDRTQVWASVITEAVWLRAAEPR